MANMAKKRLFVIPLNSYNMWGAYVGVTWYCWDPDSGSYYCGTSSYSQAVENKHALLIEWGV